MAADMVCQAHILALMKPIRPFCGRHVPENRLFFLTSYSRASFIYLVTSTYYRVHTCAPNSMNMLGETTARALKRSLN